MFFRKYENTSTHLVKNKIMLEDGALLSNWTLSSVFHLRLTNVDWLSNLKKRRRPREAYEAFLKKKASKERVLPYSCLTLRAAPYRA